jgi:DNA-binding beta-propeller fold protein YncE
MTTSSPRVRRLSRRARIALALGAVILIIAGVVGTVVALGNRSYAARPASYSNQVVLPFTRLVEPFGVAVDVAGDVYVVDTGNNRVLKLAAGANNTTVLPFTDLNAPESVAVDGAGNVYVTDNGNARLLKLPVQ